MGKNLKSVILPLLGLVLIGGLAYTFIFQDPHVSAGRKLFERNCTPCHGESGEGDGYNAENLDPQPRDLTDSEEEYMGKLDNDEIYEVIEKGGLGVEISSLMPVFGRIFSEEEIWSLVAYVRTFHRYDGEKVAFPETLETKKPRVPPITEAEFNKVYEAEVTSAEVEEELVALGSELFYEFGCIACHRIGEEGGKLGPNLSHVGFMLQPQFIYRWARNPQSFKPHTRMPNLGLNEQDALAVVLYLSTLNEPNFVEGGAAPEEEKSAPEDSDEEAAS